MIDLNPINTPKSVLTDCINGTFITYNGNEFVLQNDMGNYELKNCKLPTNFIPVGVKGYADILYIVSYNPLTKEVEIGSYPAPQSIFSTGTSPNIGPDSKNLLTSFEIKETLQYDNVIQEHKKNLYVFMKGNDQDTYKMYPGDEFKITGLVQENLDFPYQHLNFYIIDEDNKLFDIDDTELYANVSEDYKKVFWETPGWLAAQYDLYVPDKFNLNLRSLNVPEFITDNKNTSTQSELPQPDADHFEVSMNLSAQVIISDSLFREELMKDGHVDETSQQFKHLKVRFKFSCESGNFAYLTENSAQTYTGSNQTIDINCNYHNYQDDIITAYVNCTPVWFMKEPTDLDNLSDYNGTVSVEAYPIIDMGEGKVLEYTQFTTAYKFQLNNLKNKSAINIGENIYKWSVDNDSCTISFDVNGPFVNANNITGRYEIYRVNLFKYYKNITLAEQYVDGGNSENLKSASSFSIKDSPQGDILTKDIEKNKWDRTTTSLNASSFVKTKLLMCEGNISNLVLYGQNTLNIDWTSSNEYVLSDYQNTYTNPEYNENDENSKKHITTDKIEKEISFEKEGGVYLLRIILEQNHEFISDTVLPLVPSEVFNEWFGEKDNYLDENNGITGSDWVNKYWDLISVNILNPNFNVSFANSDIEIYLKQGKTKSIKCDWVDNIQENKPITWNADFIKNELEKLGLGPSEFTSLPVDIFYEVLLNPQIIKTSGNVAVENQESLKNLWNPIFKNEITFLSNDQPILTYNSISNTYSYDKNLIMNWQAIGSPYNLPTKIGSRYILDSNFLMLVNASGVMGRYNGGGIFDLTGRYLSYRGSGTAISQKQQTANNPKSFAYDYYYNDKQNWTHWIQHESFGKLGDMLNWCQSCVLPIKFNTTGNENGIITALVAATTENKDRSGNNLEVGDNGKVFLVMYVNGGSSTLSDKTIALIFTDDNKAAFARALQYIVIQNNSYTNTETLYFPYFQISNLIDSETLSLNQYVYNGRIYNLRCDDEFLLNSSYLKNLNKSLFSNYNFNYNKTINGKIAVNNITVNYTSDNIYNIFYSNITTAFNDYRNKQAAEEAQQSVRTAGTSLQYTSECYKFDNYDHGNKNFQEYMRRMFGSTAIVPNTAPTEAYVNSVIQLLTKKNSAREFTPNNITLNFPVSGLLKYEGYKNGSPSDTCSVIAVCYQTDNLGI